MATMMGKQHPRIAGVAHQTVAVQPETGIVEG
jgi:hypothetical protein